jgi:transcriptional regulator with XRE-family HTH domain
MLHVKDVFRSIRSRLRKNQVDFAHVLGVQPSTVSRYESGKLQPSRTILLLLWDMATEIERSIIEPSMGGRPSTKAVLEATLVRDADALMPELDRELNRRNFINLAVEFFDYASEEELHLVEGMLKLRRPGALKRRERLADVG